MNYVWVIEHFEDGAWIPESTNFVSRSEARVVRKWHPDVYVNTRIRKYIRAD